MDILRGYVFANPNCKKLQAENAPRKKCPQEVRSPSPALPFDRSEGFERLTSVLEARNGITCSSMVAFADPMQQLRSGSCSKHKVVYIIRHAQALHNVLEAQLQHEAKAAGKNERDQKEAAKAALPEERFRDAQLSSKGQLQVDASEKNFEQLLEQTHYPMPETVLVSPLRRTLMSASLFFPAHPDMRAKELLRERRTGFPCDERQAAAVSKIDFPWVDFSEVEELDAQSDTGYQFRKELFENYSDVARRGDKLLPLIESLEVNVVAVVSHKGFLRELLQDSWKTMLSCPENLKMEMSNAEVRVFEIKWQGSGRPPTIMMKSLQAATVEPTIRLTTIYKPSDRAQALSARDCQSSCHVAVATSNKKDVAEAIDEAWIQLRRQLGVLPTVALVFGHCTVDAALVAEKLCALQPSLSVVGGSSMQGVLTACEQPKFAIMGFVGWAKRCGVGHVDGSKITDVFSAREAGIKATNEATLGVMPDIIIMFGSSGYEEHILVGINKVCKGVRVFGGTSSNDAFIDGASNSPWQLYGGIAGWGALNNGGFVLLAIWQHKHSRMHSVISHCVGSTSHTGVITRAEGRNIYEIDHRLAGDVLQEWIGLSLPCPHKQLAQYSLAFEDEHVHRFVHFKGVGEQGELQCYASTASDLGYSSARLVRIKPSSLLGAIREVARQAKSEVTFQIRGALLILGAGTSSLLNEDDISKMKVFLSDVAPVVLTSFCTGGQGNVQSGANALHGNNVFNFLFLG
eukprot:TRINITY_DN27287_c0_g1_i1.p1 TRINITY_DN27287_c0_g1~~TRINITY_DN27287_c0_g1_i1.p1  ORF type:complete len:760 (-),score=94.32 TRINITY_DN27287_c0_g1_i1:161-2392(-)